jgi:hypothetical protein
MADISDVGATMVANGIRHLFFRRSKSLPSRVWAVNGTKGKLIEAAVAPEARAAFDTKLTCRVDIDAAETEIEITGRKNASGKGLTVSATSAGAPEKRIEIASPIDPNRDSHRRTYFTVVDKWLPH